MNKYQYIEDFKKLGFGMFVHFGLYSVLGKGEWYRFTTKMNEEDYNKLADKFFVEKDWAKKLVETAKSAGCRYKSKRTDKICACKNY